MEITGNLRIEGVEALASPSQLMAEIPLSPAGARTVESGRRQVADIVHGRNDRLLIVVGPCSIHDPAAAIEYAQRLKPIAEAVKDELCLAMRVYFEKPRTTLGWKGLINDPQLDGTFQINEGLRRGRRLLCEIADMGLPTAVEFLDPISPQFIAGLVSWGAIGARTTESQVHRELASGLSAPIGFKNGTYGTVQIAVDAVISARGAHRFLGVTDDGNAAIIHTRGNPDCHIILRGGTAGPNYDEESVAEACALLEKAKLVPRVMIDCSHGNSRKDFRRQPIVARDIAEQVSSGSQRIMGLMLESFLVEGRQELGKGKLRYGQSVTDACLGWDETERLLPELAQAVRLRRK